MSDGKKWAIGGTVVIALIGLGIIVGFSIKGYVNSEPAREPSPLDKFKVGQRIYVSDLDPGFEDVFIRLLVPATLDLIKKTDSPLVMFDDVGPVRSDVEPYTNYWLGTNGPEESIALSAFEKPLGPGQRWFIAIDIPLSELNKLDSIETRTYFLRDTRMVSGPIFSIYAFKP